MTTYFTHEDSWTGGFYELAIDVGSTSDEAVLPLLQALWSHPALDGCYLDRTREPADQLRLMMLPELLHHTHLQGIVHLPNNHSFPCGTCLLRELGNTTWIDFYIPTGALERIYPLKGFPLSHQDTDAQRQWQQPLDNLFAELGKYVFERAAYRFALIGYEVAAEVDATQIIQIGTPERRWMGYLWPTGTTLTYWPKIWP